MFKGRRFLKEFALINGQIIVRPLNVVIRGRVIGGVDFGRYVRG